MQVISIWLQNTGSVKENFVSDSINQKTAGKDSLRAKLFCFILTGVILLADQITKILITTFIQVGKEVHVIGDLLVLWHVRNLNGLFSIGHDFPELVKQIMFLWVPILVIGFVVYLILGSNEVTGGQRWILAAICGGGLGNVLDRFIRPDGVVDFVSVKFFGIFGLSRWPTFNLADSTIVICAILLLISIIATEIKIRRQGAKKASHE
jgi:signal peptidase II